MGWFFKECEHDWKHICTEEPDGLFGLSRATVYYHKCKKCGKKEECYGSWMDEPSWAKTLSCKVCGQFIAWCD